MKKAVEMLGCGRGGKPKAGFPPRPRALGNRQKRDFHIPTAPTTRPDGKVEIHKQDSHFPTGPSLYIETKKGGLAADRFAPAFRLILRENQNRRSGSFFDENMLSMPSASSLSASAALKSRATRQGQRGAVPSKRRRVIGHIVHDPAFGIVQNQLPPRQVHSGSAELLKRSQNPRGVNAAAALFGPEAGACQRFAPR